MMEAGSMSVLEEAGPSSEWFGSQRRVVINLPDLHGNGGELQCPICKGVIVDARMSAFCLHRYCRKCIERWITMQGGQKTCPICKASLASKRDLKEDKQFDAIVTALCGNVDDFKEKVDQAVQIATEKYLKEHRPLTPPPSSRARPGTTRRRQSAPQKLAARAQESTPPASLNPMPVDPIIDDLDLEGSATGIVNYISPSVVPGRIAAVPLVSSTAGVGEGEADAHLNDAELDHDPDVTMSDEGICGADGTVNAGVATVVDSIGGVEGRENEEGL
ncbi:hypothetical protein BSKO_06488 [Bryopsis sp. KO-2023]|nr:hypothetical protein BSKO_06488 [Bryopsis sp. KO-2023]